MIAEVDSLLEELRPGLMADWSDLEVVGVDGGVATIRLVLAPDACAECIVSRSAFESMLSTMLVGKVPSVTGIRFIDPREG